MTFPWHERSQDGHPLLCQEFYYRYCVDSREEIFQRFYDSTYLIFQSYAAEKCAAAGNGLDPKEIVARLYVTLVLHACGGRRFPIRALLSWCFGTILNLIREEKRSRSRGHQSLSLLRDRPGGVDPLEQMISKEDSEQRGRLYQKVLRLIRTRNDLLSDRERKVMEMFYFEGLSLRSIAENLEIEAGHTAVILHRSRRKIADLFRC